MAQSLRFGWFTHKEQRQLAWDCTGQGCNLACEFCWQANRSGWLGSPCSSSSPRTSSSEPDLTNQPPHGHQNDEPDHGHSELREAKLPIRHFCEWIEVSALPLIARYLAQGDRRQNCMADVKANQPEQLVEAEPPLYFGILASEIHKARGVSIPGSIKM